MGVLGINHIAFRTPDVERLHEFYAQLLSADRVAGEHHVLRAGTVVLAFFPTGQSGAGADPDELAFDFDRSGFDEALARARLMAVVAREPVEHTSWSRGFLVRDPDGRRVEIMYEDRGVYWREE
jgi:catechol 2,3-dioxygenase-like lactoylglutathione lyase family enzyme